MDINLMKYFCEVAKTKNISRAADNLCITQPTLSRQLRELQEEIGSQMIIRNAHGIELTAIGEMFYLSARRIVEQADLMVEKYKNISNSATGSIRIACAEGLISGLLADSLNRFIEINPTIHLDLVSGEPLKLKELVKKQEADIAIIYYVAEDMGLKYYESGFSSEIGIITHKDSVIASKGFVSIEELKNIALFSPRKALLDKIFKGYEKYIDDLDVRATFDLPYNHLTLLRNNGISMLSKSVSKEVLNLHNLVFCPLVPEIKLKTGIASNMSNNNPIKEDLINFLVSAIAE